MSGLVVKSHFLFKTADGHHTTQKTTSQSLFRACPLDHVHRYRVAEREMILREVEETHEVGASVAEHWETSCKIRKKSKTKIIRTAIGHWEIHCMTCQKLLEEFTEHLVDQGASASIGGRRSFSSKASGPLEPSIQTNPEKRPPVPRQPISPHLAQVQPVEQFQLG